jgi:hypothetical protein
MNRQERINLLMQLKDYLQKNSLELRQAKEKAFLQNGWFTIAFIDLAIDNIIKNFLQEDLLNSWLNKYKVPEETLHKKNIGIVLAGNIPLVGFHDFLCVFASGHRAFLKLSSKDNVLMAHLIAQMTMMDKRMEDYALIAEQLKNCDAYIATGSNNSGRYFEYYFGKYPGIIRKNKTSVAILNGNESPEILSLLADDIQQYFGLGCRKVTQLFVPHGYEFIPLMEALKKYQYFSDFNKYKNNFDYQLALLIMNNKFYMSNDSIILTESDAHFSPVSRVNYEFYKNKNLLAKQLENDAAIQCIVGEGYTPFGNAQSPSLTDYADGIDTMHFLQHL